MKFGFFYEVQVPRPWGPETERTAFENDITQIVLGDALGFENVWVVEHHFFEEFSHSSAPDLFLMAVADRSAPPHRKGEAV